jgi:hypothetical protein
MGESRLKARAPIVFLEHIVAGPPKIVGDQVGDGGIILYQENALLVGVVDVVGDLGIPLSRQLAGCLLIEHLRRPVRSAVDNIASSAVRRQWPTRRGTGDLRTTTHHGAGARRLLKHEASATRTR